MITHTPPCRCQLGLVFFFRHGSQRSQSKMTRGALFRVMMIMTISIGCLSATASVFAQEGVALVICESWLCQRIPAVNSCRLLGYNICPTTSKGLLWWQKKPCNWLRCLAPIDDLERFVAIAEIKPDLTCLLNPKGFDYGLIPVLRDLNPTQADQLFGQKECAVGKLHP